LPFGETNNSVPDKEFERVERNISRKAIGRVRIVGLLVVLVASQYPEQGTDSQDGEADP
jgi:hypothetical protein